MLPMTPRTPSPPSNMEVEALCFGGVFLLGGQDNCTASNLVRNVRKLKNKYDLTLCQSRLHTASETFVCHKKNSDWVRFLHPWQANAKIQNDYCQVHPLHLAAQSTVYRSLHTEFTEIGGLLFLICGSSITSIKLWHPEVNFESPVIIPLLLNKEGELSILSIF